MTEQELPQFPQEMEGECPVCGEQYFRYEATKQGKSVGEAGPFCIKVIDNGPIGVYYHA